jgi:hypothetical protein
VKIFAVVVAALVLASPAVARSGLPPAGDMPQIDCCDAETPEQLKKMREDNEKLPDQRVPIPPEIYRNDYDARNGTIDKRPVDSCGTALTPRYGEAPTSIDQLHCNHPRPASPSSSGVPTMNDAPSWLKKRQ